MKTKSRKEEMINEIKTRLSEQKEKLKTFSELHKDYIKQDEKYILLFYTITENIAILLAQIKFIIWVSLTSKLIDFEAISSIACSVFSIFSVTLE
jgi:hypothetical protein